MGNVKYLIALFLIWLILFHGIQNYGERVHCACFVLCTMKYGTIDAIFFEMQVQKIKETKKQNGNNEYASVLGYHKTFIMDIIAMMNIHVVSFLPKFYLLLFKIDYSM